MKTIINTQTGVSLYAGTALALSASGAGNGEWFDKTATTANSTMVEDVTLPADWCGGHYSYAAGVWTRTALGEAAHAATLATGRAAAWEAIKSHRTALKFSGVYVASAGKWFHSDAAESRVQLMGLKDLARDTLAAGGSMNTVLQKLGQDVYWKTMDGSFVPMTCQLAFDVVAAVGDLDALCHSVAEQHRAAMLAAADPTAYDWRTGWPAVYGGV